MKFIFDIRSLFGYYDLQDLEYFYDMLETRIKRIVHEETVGNDRISGLIWMIMAACVERIIPQTKSYTRLTKRQREEFITLAASKIKTISEKLEDHPHMAKQERENYIFTIYTMKFLITIARQDELF